MSYIEKLNEEIKIKSQLTKLHNGKLYLASKDKNLAKKDISRRINHLTYLIQC